MIKKKSEPDIATAPREGFLSWDNHRLRAANCELRIQALQALMDAENKAALDELETMRKAVGEDFLPHVDPSTGDLRFVRKRNLTPSSNSSGRKPKR